MSDIVERAKEIIEWRKTGILTGDALRARAREIREKLGDVFNMGEALHQAENATNKEALQFVIENYDTIERLTAERDNARREAQTMRVKPEEKRFVDDEAEILQRLATGDTIVFSMDGDMAWFTKGDHAFVGDAIMSLREKGYLLRKRDVVDDDDDPRGIASYDTISDSGRAAIMALKGERG